MCFLSGCTILEENLINTTRKEQNMTNQNEPLQQNPSSSQENFLTLDEELLENVAGAGGCQSCFKSPEQTAPEPLLLQSPTGHPLTAQEASQMFLRDHPSPEARANPLYDIRPVRTNSGRELHYKILLSPSTSQPSPNVE
jgi:hypothetical protein